MIYTYDIGFGAGSGNAEDLMPVVVNIAPWDTPLFSTAPKTTARDTNHSWLNDTLAATASGTDACRVEGAAFSATTATAARTRLTNITIIPRIDFEVSMSQRASNPAGVVDEYTYQAGKHMKELTRNIEVLTFQAAASATGSTAAVRMWKGLQDWLPTTGNAWHADATAIGGAGGLTATACLLTEDIFNGALEVLMEAGANIDSCYVRPRIKRRISKVFVGVSGTRQNLAALDRTLNNAIDIYISDFGRLKIIPDRWLPAGGTGSTVTGNVFFIDTPMVRYAFLRPIKHVPLPPNGDSARGMVLGELTIEVGHPDAIGRIFGVSTALA